MSELWQRINIYRLAKRNGELVLQELWSKAFPGGETEWRDKPTVELPPNDSVQSDDCPVCGGYAYHSPDCPHSLYTQRKRLTNANR